MVARLTHSSLMRTLFWAFCLTSLAASAQLARHASPAVAEQLYVHERYLASDELGGRLPGSEGGAEAAAYIQNAFRQMGLSPLFDERFTQEVKIPDAAKVSSATNYMVVGKDSVRLTASFWPSTLSSNGTVAAKLAWIGYGLPAEVAALPKGSIAVFVRDLPKDAAAKAGKAGALALRVSAAQRAGAAGVIVLAPVNVAPRLDLLRRTRPVGIPVVEVHDVKWAKRLAKSAKKGKAANLATEIVAQQITAPNVGAWLDRGKPRTIVIGAHYDHVGLGAWGSRKPELAGQVHNGADDNASGTSVLLTLAQMLAKVPSLGDANLAFVAFTGEESGLLGSKEFVETIPAPLGKVTTMLNLDMVGRLNRSDSLRVYGVHTAPEFQQMLETIPADGFYWDLRNEIFARSDHAPFIQKGIPAVFFFTGLHEDYHAPGDDLEKIDLDGMAAVTEAAAAFIQLLANNAPPTFNPESSKD